MITSAAMKNGFTGGLVVDFPNSKKAKKYYLYLTAGFSEEIHRDAEKAVLLPKARIHGEDYSFEESSSEESSSEDEDMEDAEDSSGEEESDGKKGKTRDKQIRQM